MSIARVALPVATSQLFDYWVPAGADVRAGAIVKVSLGRRRIAGVVIELPSESSVARDRLMPIDEVVALPPLPEDVRDLCAFVAEYYQAPLGLAYALATPPLSGSPKRRNANRPVTLTESGRTALPPTLARAPVARALFARLEPDDTALDVDAIAALSPNQRRILRGWIDRGYLTPVSILKVMDRPLRLNDAQRVAAEEIDAVREAFAPFLLDGVAGSGKTDVYLSAAATSVANRGQVLMLVPEINLTPQLVARVKQALPRARTVALHSGLAEGERVSNWREAAEGTADVVLGTRLAIFTPMPRLNLIVVDEEHDGSYKQQDTVRYHARDVALWRGRRRSVRVVLGSATPSLESYANADAGRYQRLVLQRRADPRALPPVMRLVPARGEQVGGQAVDDEQRRDQQALGPGHRRQRQRDRHPPQRGRGRRGGVAGLEVGVEGDDDQEGVELGLEPARRPAGEAA